MLLYRKGHSDLTYFVHVQSIKVVMRENEGKVSVMVPEEQTGSEWKETFPESWGSCWKLKRAWGLDHNVETIIIFLCEGLVLVPWKMVLVLGKTYWRVLCAVRKVSTLYRHWRFSVHLKLLVNKLLFKTIMSIKGEKTMSFAIEAKLYPDPSHPKWWCNSLLYDFTYFKRALGEDYISSHCVLGAVDDPDVVQTVRFLIPAFHIKSPKKNLLGPKNELSKPADTKSVYRNPL